MNTKNYIAGLQELIQYEEIRMYRKTHGTPKKLINELLEVQACNPDLVQVVIIQK